MPIYLEKSQLAVPATVLMKAGKQTLERTISGDYVVVKDGMLTDWITFYDHQPQWVRDGVFSFNRDIVEALNVLALNHYAQKEREKM